MTNKSLSRFVFCVFLSGEKILVIKMEITVDAAKIKDFYKEVIVNYFMATNLKT